MRLVAVRRESGWISDLPRGILVYCPSGTDVTRGRGTDRMYPLGRVPAHRTKKNKPYRTHTAEMLDKSIQFDIPLNNLTVVNNHKYDTMIWLGELSKGGKCDLSMEINLTNPNLAGGGPQGECVPC